MTAIHSLEILDPAYRPVGENKRSGIYTNNYMGPECCRSRIPTLVATLSSLTHAEIPTRTGDFTLLLPVHSAILPTPRRHLAQGFRTVTQAKVELLRINFSAIL